MAAVALLETASASQQNAPQDATLLSLRQAADRGDPIAQTGLAFRLTDGRGIGKNVREAVRLLRLAQSQGSPLAQMSLAALYAVGNVDAGVQKDVNRAVELYRAAMERPDADYPDTMPGNFEYETLRQLTQHAPSLAAISLGEWYEGGQFVLTDYAEALRLYRWAAEKGNPAGASHLAVMYEAGKGVPPDNVEAEKWFIVAASKPGSNQAGRERLALKLTRDQLGDAQRRAAEWLRAFPLKP